MPPLVNSGGCMADWKLPHHLQDTASIVRRNWLMLTMGLNYTIETEAGDVDDVPDWMKRKDQDNNPKGWRE